MKNSMHKQVRDLAFEVDLGILRLSHGRLHGDDDLADRSVSSGSRSPRLR
jgi:hypothetical protein